MVWLFNTVIQFLNKCLRFISAKKERFLTFVFVLIPLAVINIMDLNLAENVYISTRKVYIFGLPQTSFFKSTIYIVNQFRTPIMFAIESYEFALRIQKK